MGQKELSVCLRIVVAAAAVFLALVCALFVPILGAEIGGELGDLYGILTQGFLWLTALPAFAALCLAWLIFTEIGRNNSFCAENARRLKLISRLALADTVLYIGLSLALCCFDLMHPSVMIMLSAVIIFGIAMTVAGAALSHLTRKAADMKADNDLTI